MLSGRLWYVNANNNGGRGYGFCVENLADLIEREKGSFYGIRDVSARTISVMDYRLGRCVHQWQDGYECRQTN